MDEEQFLKEFQEVMQRVIEAETNDFFELAKILGRDPKNDLAGADLSEVNLSGGDLRGANLRKTDLVGADLSQSDLSGADLTKADLSDANLTETNFIKTNLTETIFKDAKLKYARFGNNPGLSEDMKLDLGKRGAIFENYHPEVEDNELREIEMNYWELVRI